MGHGKNKVENKDAISILLEDHQDMKHGFTYFNQICNRILDEKKELADELCSLFIQHAVAEEEIFYPAVRESVKHSRNMVNEALVEHATAKDLAAQIQSMSPDEELYNAKVKVLGELIEHHIQDEEEEMFAKARESDMDLVALGDRIDARKLQLAGGIPPASSRKAWSTFPDARE